MKIAIIWKNDYPWDVRVEKIGTTLLAMGHEVHIIARNLRRERTVEGVGGMHVHRLNTWQSSVLNSMVSIPSIGNPLWLTKIHKVCVQHQIDLILVRDLPLLVNGVIVGKMLRIPVIFDMAEVYSAMWSDLNRARGFSLSTFLLKNPTIGKLLEKYAIRRADHTFVVVEEAKQYLMDLGIANEKISIVSNTPDLTALAWTENGETVDKWPDKLILLYHGYINEGRGLEAVVRAIPELRRRFDNVLLVLIGAGDGLERFRELARRLNVTQHVVFMGWRKLEEIPTFIKAATICIVPHLATAHKDTTVPNKLFDYMACGKPVVVSDAKPLRRIVEEERCGLFFRSGDIDSFVEAVTRVARDASLAHQFGANGSAAVRARYNWANDSGVLKRVIKQYGAR